MATACSVVSPTAKSYDPSVLNVLFLLSCGANPEVLNVKGRTMLHIAAERGSPSIVKALLARGLDIDAGDTLGITPLMLAVISKSEAVVQLLLLYGSNVNARRMIPDGTALTIAARIGTPLFVRLLIDNGANVNARTFPGNNPVLSDALLAPEPNLESIRLLISGGANLEAIDDLERSMLYVAIERGELDSVRLLIERGADVNAVNKWGQTALMRTVCDEESHRKVEIIKLLLDTGANMRGNDVIISAVETVQSVNIWKRAKYDKMMTVLLKASAKEAGLSPSLRLADYRLPQTD